MKKEEERQKPRMRHRYLFAWLYGIGLTGYAVFSILYVFVIPHGTVSIDELATALNVSTEVSSTTGEETKEDDQAQSDKTVNKTKAETGNKTAKRSGVRSSSKNGNKNKTGSKSRSSAEDEAAGQSESGQSVVKDEAAEQSESANSAVQDEAALQSVSGQSTFSGEVLDVSTCEQDGLKVTMTTGYIYDTKVYIADVVLTDGNSLLTGLAEDSFGRNVTEKTSDIASRLGAVLAVNGDFYGFRDEGYVIRNGYLYRSEKSDDDAEDFVVYADGSCEIIREGDISAEELLEKGAVQVYSFGPALVQGGSVIVGADDEVDKSMTSNPRTAIGYVSENHFVLVVSDGRTDESEGLSLEQLASVMQEAGCVSAYNLDGGGSSTMYYQGEVYNNPTTNGSIKERKVSDIVYVK